VPHSLDNLRTILLCDDIRTETGNKFSLMGLLTGDLLVSEFPASINMAFFMQYHASAEEEGTLHLDLRFLKDDLEIAKARLQSEISKWAVANFIVSRAFVTFEKECVFRVMMGIDGGEEREVFSRRILKGS
jgi:hypothetical protein